MTVQDSSMKLIEIQSEDPGDFTIKIDLKKEATVIAIEAEFKSRLSVSEIWRKTILTG